MDIRFLFNHAKNSPIPSRPSKGPWKEIAIHECSEPLVPLGPFLSHQKAQGFLKGQSDAGFSDRIFTDAVYWGERNSSPYKRDELDGALLTCFAREGVAKRLVQAASYLPQGYALLVWDSYRPLSTQAALYQDYYNQLVEKKETFSRRGDYRSSTFCLDTF